jgi:hypothetical protein
MTSEQPESAVEVLKPCPFCGGQAAFVPCEAGSSVGQVFCQECDTSAGEYQTAFGLTGDAAKAWNTRATQPAEAQGAGDVERLREALQAALDDPRDRRSSRDSLGRLVREVWVKWAAAQPNCKPSWLLPYDELSGPDQEVDRLIGEALANRGISAWLSGHRFLFRDVVSALAAMPRASQQAGREAFRAGFKAGILTAGYPDGYAKGDFAEQEQSACDAYAALQPAREGRDA